MVPARTDDAAGTSAVKTMYASIAIQINAEAPQSNSEEPSVKNDKVKPSRVPITSGRNKTFPLSKTRCKDDCRAASEPITTPSRLKSRKQSRVKWEGVDQPVQTDSIDLIEPKPEEGNQQSAESCTPSPENMSTAPGSHTLPPGPGPEFEPQPAAEPEADPELNSRPGLCHSCTSRSSLTCQQCFPTRQGSVSIPPVHTCPWNIPFQDSPAPTEGINTAEPATEAQEPAKPPTANQANEEVAENDGAAVERSAPVAEVIEAVYIEEPLIPQPSKRPSLSRLKLKQPTTSLPLPQRALYTTTLRSKPCSKPLPQNPTVVNFPIQLPDMASNSSLSTFNTFSPNPGQITDRHVFKGLHVATAAACDEDLDKWIEEITGCGVRKFLADLSRFDGLGVNTLADVARRAAKQRKDRIRAWEVVREARVVQREAHPMGGGGQEAADGCAESPQQPEWVVGEMGVVASDGMEEELVCRVVHARDCKASEDGKRGGC